MTKSTQGDSIKGSESLKRWDPSGGWQRPVVCSVVEGISRFVVRAMNRLEIEGQNHWQGAFQEPGRGVLSFSNHVSLFDDPLLIANLGRTRPQELRWVGADDRNFFGNALKGWIYSAGKVVPLIRGAGLEQPGFDHLMERLKAGDWVHIFPEGGRTRDPEGRLRTPFKRGIGKLLEGAKPIAIPFYHYGMHKVLPIGASIPRFGTSIQVQFGEYTSVTADWLEQFTGQTKEERWDAISAWSHRILRQLEERVHPNPLDPTPSP